MRATTTTTLDRARARGRGPSRARARAARRAGPARRRMAARPAPASGSASRRRPARRARCREHRQVVRLGRRDHEGRRPRCCGIAAPPSGSGTTRCGSPGGLPRRGDPWRRLPGRRGRHRRRGIPCRGAVAALAPPRRGPGAPHAERRPGVPRPVRLAARGARHPGRGRGRRWCGEPPRPAAPALRERSARAPPRGRARAPACQRHAERLQAAPRSRAVPHGRRPRRPATASWPAPCSSPAIRSGRPKRSRRSSTRSSRSPGATALRWAQPGPFIRAKSPRREPVRALPCHMMSAERATAPGDAGGRRVPCLASMRRPSGYSTPVAW